MVANHRRAEDAAEVRRSVVRPSAMVLFTPRRPSRRRPTTQDDLGDDPRAKRGGVPRTLHSLIVELVEEIVVVDNLSDDRSRR